MASETEITEITERVKEYGEISKTIKLIQEKLKVLNKKKKELYKFVVPKLKTTNITKCNLAYGTLKVVNSKRKVMPTKVTIKDKYLAFFNTRALEPDFGIASAQEKANILYQYIYVDNTEFKEEQTISMTYNKEFKDQLKQLTI
jgi:hypothetical protein